MKFCVIGLGQFGKQLVRTLADNGNDVLAIDQYEEHVNAIRKYASQAICIKLTDQYSLEQIGIEDVDIVVIAIGKSFDQTVQLCTLLKHRLKTKQVIARTVTGVQKEALVLLGVDYVIRPEQETAITLADNLTLPFQNIAHIAPNYSAAVIPMPSAFEGKSLEEIDLHGTYHVQCLGIQKGSFIELIEQDYIVNLEDNLVLAGRNEDLTRVLHLTD